MSQYKNSDDYNLYYTDTDSIIIDKPLKYDVISNDIGLWKLKNELKEGVFGSPKLWGAKVVYPINTVNEFTKVRGYMNALKYSDLKKLLKKGASLNLKQEKSFKCISKGYMSFIKQTYKLITTDFKRKLIYRNKKLVGTTPLILKDGHLISK